MFKKLKMRLAAKSVKRVKDFNAADKRARKKHSPFAFKLMRPFVWLARAVRWLFDTICAICAWIWAGICDINVIGLLNATMLIAIIVLFSSLIMNVLSCGKKQVIVVSSAKNTQTITTENSRNGVPALPLRRNEKTGRMPCKISVVPVKESDNPALHAQGDGKIYGDVVIETRGEAAVLKNNAQINGNLYLQHMHKYILPCGIKINGNLFLRDLHMLEFCGDFTVTGNIYVSPRSSFGPLPRGARIGGQVIL
jgi:hypothetical protein